MRASEVDGALRQSSEESCLSVPFVPVLLGTRRLAEYAEIVPSDELLRLRERAHPLAGLRVLHLSASPFGSPAAEMLSALVPLQRELGIDAHWQLLRDVPAVSALMYRGLRGEAVVWGRAEQAAWRRLARRDIPRDFDVVVTHDPHAVAVYRPALDGGRARCVWHCHLDVHWALDTLWRDLCETLAGYSAILLASHRLPPGAVPVPRVRMGRPAVDPCSPRNAPLSPQAVRSVVAELGIDPTRPLLGQFAPIDTRFGSVGALGTFRLLRRLVPGVQIVLAEARAPLAFQTRTGLDQIMELAGDDPDVHLLSSDAGLGPTEINALQRACTVALQMAVPSGFGWGLAECQWKAKPAIVGPHGDLPEQVGYGQGGYVADGTPDACEAILRLFGDARLADEMGRRGHEHIATRHLITSLASDYVELFRDIYEQPYSTAAV